MNKSIEEFDKPTAGDADPIGGEILVLGIGNSLYGDDGVGPQVIAALQRTALPSSVRCVDGGTCGLALAGWVEDCERLIVVDAAELHEAPGTIRILADAAMDTFLARAGRRSVHEVGLADLMAAVSLIGTAPKQRVLVAVQPERLDWGLECSAAVTAAIAKACQVVQRLIREDAC